MKKQLLSTLLALCMVLALTACGGKSDTPSDSDSSKGTQQTQNNEASKKSKDLAASITADTAEAWGVCGADMEWYYQNNILVLRGTGAVMDGKDVPWEKYKKDINRVIVENGCTRLGNGSFYEYSNLSSIVLPDTLEEIGSNTFYRCYQLPSITLPDSVRLIEHSAFYECTALAEVELSKNLETIGETAFCGCESLASISLPNSLKVIGSSAFYECTALTEVVLPDSLEELGGSVFGKCSINSITLPANLTTIVKNPFGGMDSLERVDVKSPHFTLEDRILYTSDKKTLICCLPNSQWETFIIPNGVETVNENAFLSVTIKSLTVPSSMKHISEKITDIESITFLGDAPEGIGNTLWDSNITVYYSGEGFDAYMGTDKPVYKFVKWIKQ